MLAIQPRLWKDTVWAMAVMPRAWAGPQQVSKAGSFSVTGETRCPSSSPDLSEARPFCVPHRPQLRVRLCQVSAGRSGERGKKEEAWSLSSTGFSSQMAGPQRKIQPGLRPFRGKRGRFCRTESSRPRLGHFSCPIVLSRTQMVHLFLLGSFGLLEWLPSLSPNGCYSSNYHLLTHEKQTKCFFSRHLFLKSRKLSQKLPNNYPFIFH